MNILECENGADMKLLIILYEFYYSFQIGFMFRFMEITVVIQPFVGRKFFFFFQTVVYLSMQIQCTKAGMKVDLRIQK